MTLLRKSLVASTIASMGTLAALPAFAQSAAQAYSCTVNLALSTRVVVLAPVPLTCTAQKPPSGSTMAEVLVAPPVALCQIPCTAASVGVGPGCGVGADGGSGSLLPPPQPASSIAASSEVEDKREKGR